VAPDLIGKSGRKVRCANCQKDWRATIEVAANEKAAFDEAEKPDTKIDEAGENALDAVFEAAEQANLPPSSKPAVKKPDGLSELAKKRMDMTRRKSMISASMPRARLRRMVRIGGVVVLLLTIFSSLLFRENIVRTFPDLAGIYDSIGVGVNIIGLEFSEVKTLKSLNMGVEMLDISASINSVSSSQVVMPRVIISLLDEGGNSIFDWSVTPQVAVLFPGERFNLETQLSAPPLGTQSVRLAFEGSN